MADLLPEVTSAPELRGPRHLSRRPRVFLPDTWALEWVLLDVAMGTHWLWVSRACAAALLAVLPGQLLLRALRVPGETVRECVVYLPCASIAVMIVTSLAVDLAGPMAGVGRPLRLWPLFVGLNLALVLLTAVGVRAPRSCEFNISAFLARMRWLWPFLLPLVAVAAVLRLNNGHGNALALVVLIAVPVLLIGCTVAATRLDHRHTSLMIYASGLSAILLTSMRSSYIVGYDISSEYYIFHSTVTSGIWHTGHMNPYEAMLSLTVLPASLHALVGGQDIWIFKLGYPALLALFPIAVFSIGRRFLSNRAAFLAAAVVLVQTYFFQQQPEIARQELALVVFVGMIAALLDASLSLRAQLYLAGILAATLVVSHYTTTYVAIFLCLVVLVFRLRSAPNPLSPWVATTGLLILVAVIWYIPVTHSGNNVTYVAQSVHRNGVKLLPGRTKGENVISAYFNGVRAAPPTPSQYQQAIITYYRKSHPYVLPLPAAQNPAYDLQEVNPPRLPDRVPLIASGLEHAEFLVQQAINALGILGALVVAMRRRTNHILRTVGLLGIASAFVLAASRLSGTFAADYNSSRLFLQCLVVLSLLEVSLIETIAVRLRAIPFMNMMLYGGFAAVLALAYIGNSDVSAPLTGGNPPIILYNSGEDYSRLYVTPQEQTAAQWLAHAVPKVRVIYADDYGQLQLDQFTDLRTAVFTDITPGTLDEHAWVYASRTNIVDGLTWGDTSAGELEFKFPKKFLDTYFDVVYSTGTTEVLH